VLYASQVAHEARPPAERQPDPRRRAPRRGGRVGTRGKGPWWARLLVIAGTVLMLASGATLIGFNLLVAGATGSITQTNLLGNAGNQATTRHVNITGPVNILLIGIDTRPGQSASDLSRSDSIIIVHIPASHDQAYLVSIPRDTYVPIPANPKTNWTGGRNKINAAFAFGSQNGGGIPGGVRLLGQTIKSLYGIGFDAAAVVDFAGFQQVVGVLGGVDMCVDEKTTSIHVGFARDGKETVPFRQDANLGLHPIPGVTPKMYQPGCQHLSAWEALDYTRQRDLLANGDGDYGRQRHQQQFLKAIFKETLSAGVLTNPGKLAKVLDTVGKAMTVDTGGISIPDWIFAMRSIGASDMLTIKTNNGQYDSINVPGIGACENLTDTSLQLLQAVKDDNVAAFVAAYPDWAATN
jgi:polyisoprenyl-teichoic acid--peptidoglycan teichoic acid transferase